MGKQSQIIIFRVVSGRPDLGLCLKLFRVRRFMHQASFGFLWLWHRVSRFMTLAPSFGV